MTTALTEQVIDQLRNAQIEFTLLHHDPVVTSEEAAAVRGTPLEQGAKALVFRAGARVVLIVLPAHRRVDSKGVKQALGVKDLRMVSPDELRELTGMEVGAVPPFGSLMGLPTYVDERLLRETRISFNAGSRTTSIIMAPADYERIEQPIVGHFAAD